MTKIKTQPKNRIVIIDIIRGFCLLSMIAYHTMWDCVYIFGVKAPWFRSEGAYLWQQSICWTFILLSGFCWSLGKKHFTRGLLVFGGGAVISLATILAMPSEKILFGVLTLIGSCMLLMIPLDFVLKKLPPLLGFIFSSFLFFITRNVARGNLGFEKIVLYELPKSLYKDYISTYLGFPFRGFSSSDYFPLLPWIFLFISGYFIFRIINKNGAVKEWKRKKPVKEPITFLGRNSFWVYMLHQPIVYGILFIIFKII